MDLVAAAAIPGQEFFMRGFGEGDVKNAGRELADAVARRTGGG
jgi:hypothetical protein